MFLMKQKMTICVGSIALALALSGCGGTSLSSSSVAPSPASDPTVEGLQPNAAAGAGNLSNPYQETSGLGSPDGTIGYITGAVDSDSAAIPGIAQSVSPSNPNIMTSPLGFAPGGQYFSSQGGAPFIGGPDGKSSAFQAALPNASVIFRAAIANGVDPTTTPPSAPPLVPSSIKLTSTDPAWASVAGLKTDDPKNAPNGYLPMAFDTAFAKAPTGPLANDNYVTGTADALGNLTGSVTPFALPFTTSGLHNLRVTVADTRGTVHHTDFQVLVTAQTDAAVIAQIAAGVPTGSPKGTKATLLSATAAITSPITGPVNQITADPLTSVVILFAQPGSQTITVTGQVQVKLPGQPAQTIVETATDTQILKGGSAFNTTDGANPYVITLASTNVSGSIRQAHSIN